VVGQGSTIAAIATPPGPARRGIVRLSGARTGELVRAVLCAEAPAFETTRARACVVGEFDDGVGRQPVRVLWQRGPRSYTREDVAEFHLPGAEPLLARALARLLELGAGPARPGEFTRRAFEHGRLDLSQAEGVLALIESGGEAERRAAAQLVEGGLERRTRAMRQSLLELSALCEASLDFDESDTGHVPPAELHLLGTAARSALEEALAWEEARAAPTGLARVVLAGAPNAGKSSLWNRLTGGEALVSARAGTTRDRLEAAWDLGPAACLLVDGPGEAVPTSEVEAAAHGRHARAREQADLVLWVVDSSAPAPLAVPEEASLLVWSQSDRPGARPRPGPEARTLPWRAVSARTGAGLAELAAAVAELLTGGRGPEGGLARALHARHRAALRAAAAGLDEALAWLAGGAALDLVAEALRSALAGLDELAGRSTAEDVLDLVFARFCIGK